MSDLRVRTGHARAATRPMIVTLLACLLLSLALMAAGCGGDAADADTTVTTAGTATTAASGSGAATETTAAGAGQIPADVAKMGGTALGTATVLAWNECLVKVAALLKDKPAAATVQAQLEALKEEYIQKFVAFGRQHETFDEEQLRLWRVELGINSPKNWNDYQTAANAYIMDTETPQEFKDLIQDFNIITQYSDFTLLKTQEPEEAARLGIK